MRLLKDLREFRVAMEIEHRHETLFKWTEFRWFCWSLRGRIYTPTRDSGAPAGDFEDKYVSQRGAPGLLRET